MHSITRRSFIVGAAAVGVAMPYIARGAGKYGPGASDTEIKIGNTMPYSGPASAYGVNGQSMKAVFDRVNEEGGINGRKINFLSVDDAYNPAKTVEVTRKLVESDQVLFLTGMVGTAPNAAIQRYLNQKKVPHLLVGSGADRWNNPKEYPFTTPGCVPPFTMEGFAFAKDILRNNPGAKIAVLYQNDDLGKEYLKGLKEGLGDKVSAIVAEVSYEVSDPSVDSQVITLKNSGADVLANFSTPKAGAQAVRKIADLGWKPAHYIASVGQSVPATMVPAGIENAQGIISTLVQRDPNDTGVRDTPEYKEYEATITKYHPDANLNDSFLIHGYNVAHLTLYLLRQAGDDLTRENIMHVATHIDTVLPMTLPGIVFKNSPENYASLNSIQLGQLKGDRYEPIGDVIHRA